jgi:hypothetical protein
MAEGSSAARSVLVVLCLLGAAPARAGEPLTFFGGRLRLGGEVSGTLAPEDQGYFNYSSYGVNNLRLFRVDVTAEARLASFASILADVRSDNLDSPRMYALYLRVRPWSGRAFDIQAGLVPPVFGSFPRRRYVYDNPLPSVPLVYQYLTILRDDAVPSRAEDLVAQRGRGWLVRYPVGESYLGPGLPVVSGEKWDTGLEVRVGDRPWSLGVAVTQGTLSNPLTRDDNGGKQVSARLAWTPSPALAIGASGATGDFLSDDVQGALPPAARGTYRQQALGADVEWSAGYWIVRAEAVWSRWRVPALEPTLIRDPLPALGAYGEARYKLGAGFFLAARVERLGFSEIDSAAGRLSWDAPVTRVEAGAGWSPWRYVLLKTSWQHNWRDGGRVRENDLVAGQVVVWY